MSNTIKLLIADDHTILRDGIVSLLQQEENFMVTGTASNGYEVLELSGRLDFDICLLDINMPGLDGLETAKILRTRKPAVKIIMLTSYNDREIIAEMIHLGVEGYLLKNADKAELVEAIHKVMKGRHYFSGDVEDIILQELVEKKPADLIILTEREQEVLQLLAREFTNEKIASALHISYRTVETHRKNIMQKTQSHNLAGLLKYAYSKGLVK